MKKFLPIILAASILIILIAVTSPKGTQSIKSLFKSPKEIAENFVAENPSITPTPTPKPLTFTEMNALYGPCVVAPVIMYHHVEDPKEAQKEGHLTLAVSPDFFKEQMNYLKDNGYTTVKMDDVINFFDTGVPISKKSVLLTFDDGYKDFAVNAFPVLRDLGFNATMFLPTGLVDNPGYLSWEDISNIQDSGNILFANHTWSHHNLVAGKEVIEKEISLADTQLTQKGLGNPKVFAYPYGTFNNGVIEILSGMDYKLAFTTRYGWTLCKKQRFDLPRVRLGNAALSSYGF